MTADLLALLDSDPAAGVLAASDLLEDRAKLAACLHPADEDESASEWWSVGELARKGFDAYDAVHIASASNPEFALAAVRRWRRVVERHTRIPSTAVVSGGSTDQPLLNICDYDERSWPCPDLTETADEALAYLGGPA